jgi:two-component system NarL family sensor kinase
MWRRGLGDARNRPVNRHSRRAAISSDSSVMAAEDGNAATSSTGAARTVGIVRAALLVAIGLGALIDDRPAQYQTTFYVVLIAATASAVVELAFPTRRNQSLYVFVGLDLIVLATLAHSSGGAASEVRFAFFAIPVLAAMLFGPRATLLMSIAVVTTYLTLALTQPPDGVTQDQQPFYVELVYLAWAAIAAVLLSKLMTRRAQTIADLARSRGRLTVEVLDAEDRERKRLANWLHDGPVQNLLVVGQDLAEAERGDQAALERARGIVRDTIPQLRNVLTDLHPGLLTSTGLAPALEALATAQAQHASFTVDVSADEGAEGTHDQLLLSLARELLINVGKHAQAKEVRISVSRRPDEILLEVSDDGRGFDLARRAEAVADGHIGLASSTERVESLGGRLEITSAPGRGTRVHVAIPDRARP